MSCTQKLPLRAMRGRITPAMEDMPVNTLPVHPIFGEALGLRRNGSPIWPIRGASSEGDPPIVTPPTTPTPPVTPPANPNPNDPEGLGDAGKKALEEERTARKAADKARRDAEAELQKLKDASKSEEERRDDRIRQLEKDAAMARRYEAAAAAGIPLTSAHRLNGDTAEELLADAEKYKAEIGAGAPQSPAEPQAPPTPRPDRRQGGGQREVNDGSMASGAAAYAARKAKGRT